MSTLHAGIARTIINPPAHINLCGYAGRSPGNLGIHDDLYAKALVITNVNIRAAIVTLDLIGLDADQVAWIRREASTATGIPGEHVLIGASHTHSGPATQKIRACGKVDEPFVEEVRASIVDTIVEAAKDMRPAGFGFGTAEARIAVNRRFRASSGRIELTPNAGGVTDPQVGIWQFSDKAGKPIAVIFNCACHAVVMCGENRFVSGDWPGAAARAIEAGVGGQAMFLQGCCGNINPCDRASFEMVEKTGGEVADAVLNALSRMRAVGDMDIAVASEVVHLPFQPPPSMEELTRTEAEMKRNLAGADGTNLGLIHISEAYLEWAQTLIAGRIRDSIPFEIQRFSIGDGHIIALPGEVFVEYALGLKKLAPNVMVAGYANGNIGYIPPRDAFPEGGYEIDSAPRLYGEQVLSPECEDIILKAGARLLRA